MDQANMLSIIGGLYDKLVADVSAHVLNAIKAEVNTAVAAHNALEPETFRNLVRESFENDDAMRDSLRDMIGDALDGYDLDQNMTFSELSSKVNELESTVEDISIDADNDTFDEQVRRVLRNAL